MSHIMKHSLLSDRQFGFRPGSSTLEALVSVKKEWFDYLGRRESVGCVFFGLSKAFDTLPHRLILESLAGIGVGGALLSWFEDYLSGRSQRVVLEGVASSSAKVTLGVPQGSILGPLLFVLSVDSLSRLSISASTRIKQFADDIVLYRPLNCSDDHLALQGMFCFCQTGWRSVT